MRIGKGILAVLALYLLLARSAVRAGQEEGRAENAAQSFEIACITTLGTVYGYRTEDAVCLFLPDNLPETVTFCCDCEVVSAEGGEAHGYEVTVGGFPEEKEVRLFFADGSAGSVMLLRADQPCLNLVLDGVTLDTVWQDKEAKYGGNTVFLTDADVSRGRTEYRNVTVKGRGNTSWRHSQKKSYQIRLEEKASVLGMEEARKWLLLDNTYDGSLLRNMAALTLAAGTPLAYTPEGRTVNLWINGSYQGVYLLAEKVEIQKNRLNLRNPGGILAEMDNIYYQEEEVRFCSGVSGMHYVLKDSVEEENAGAFTSFCRAVEELEAVLAGNLPWSEVAARADVESFACIYLVNELFHNIEVAETSFYLYRDGPEDVIHAGPAWDFDCCAGYRDDAPEAAYLANTTFPGSGVTNLFYLFGRYPEYAKIVQNLYETCCLPVISTLPDYLEQMKDKMAMSGRMNDLRWASMQAGIRGKDSVISGSFADNVDFLKQWLEDHFAWFVPLRQYPVRISALSGAEPVRTITVDDPEGELLYVRADLWRPQEGVEAAGHFPLVWRDGCWTVSFNLADCGPPGEYYVYLYRFTLTGKKSFLSHFGVRLDE